jgi:acetyltransferase-like isoleucine patch superfamily enzyme
MFCIIHKASFVLRFRYYNRIISMINRWRYVAMGMKVGNGTGLPKIYITWPHQVALGSRCRLEHDIVFKYDGIWRPGPKINIGNNVFIGYGSEFNIRVGIEIGNDCLIASGSKFIDHDHGIDKNELMRKQHGPESSIKIADDVWIGCNVTVLKGVEIGKGAVVGANAVVTKSIPSYEIWAGVPAKKIGSRF